MAFNDRTAIIVGAAAGLNLSVISGRDVDVFALNSAYGYLKKNGIHPLGLISGDRRFINKQSKETLPELKLLVTFDYEVGLPGYKVVDDKLKLFRCIGRDGFSSDGRRGFFHGCSSFFLAIQYLVFCGYKSIETVGVKFPPPEAYTRLDDSAKQPEFVYHIQLANLFRMRDFLQKNYIKLKVHDLDSVLATIL